MFITAFALQSVVCWVKIICFLTKIENIFQTFCMQPTRSVFRFLIFHYQAIQAEEQIVEFILFWKYVSSNKFLFNRNMKSSSIKCKQHSFSA